MGEWVEVRESQDVEWRERKAVCDMEISEAISSSQVQWECLRRDAIEDGILGCGD